MPRSPSPDDQTPTSGWKLGGLVAFLAGVVATLGFVHIDPFRPHDLTPQQHIAACEKAHKVPKDTTIHQDDQPFPKVLRRCTWPPVNEAEDGYYQIHYDQVRRPSPDPIPEGVSPNADRAERLGTPCTTVEFQTLFSHMSEMYNKPVTARTGLVIDAQGHPQLLETPWTEVVAPPGPQDLVIMLDAHTSLYAVKCVQ
jgi:hypothetical protein